MGFWLWSLKMLFEGCATLPLDKINIAYEKLLGNGMGDEEVVSMSAIRRLSALFTPIRNSSLYWSQSSLGIG
jgi:hypothetical protein